MPPAFVLSQDQTLRKYLRSAFSKLFCSLKNCSVALFLKHWIYFAWLFNFQRTPAASRRQLIYNTTVTLSCQHFFKSFLETFEAVFFTCRLWLSAHPPTYMYYTYFLLLCQDLFPFFPLIYLSLFLSADKSLKYRALFLITYFPLMYTMFFVFVLPLAYSFYSYLRFTPALIFYISFTFYSQYYVESVCQSHYVDIVSDCIKTLILVELKLGFYLF